MKIEYKGLGEITPYEKNPRNNEKAVDYVAKSIKEFGFKVPIVVDKNGVIIAGHTRYLASKKLGLEEVPVIYADDLSDEQVKAYRLADNKVSEQASWNEDLLLEELSGIVNIDMEDFGFDLSIEDEEEENPYTTKTDIPQYEITGAEPTLEECVDEYKVQELLEEIENSNVSEEQKEFLRKAATRHYGFNYKNVAEYYAHQDKEMQELMEKSALVLIDIDNAIANGYVKLSGELEEIFEDE